MHIQLDQVRKRLGSREVVAGVSLEIREGEFFFLLGPSGCGKTTLLRLLAGFLTPDSGEIFFGKDRMNEVPPQKRNTALVFQNYALWPHLTVEENVAYGLRVRKMKEAEIRVQVEEMLVRVRLEDFSKVYPSTLSGGQQQRVALARAMAVQPRLLLFDEPLSNLDARLRAEMREEIRAIQKRAAMTSLYVTHDQEEALSMADRLGVMKEGCLLQVGTPQEVYRHPNSPFVAAFLGEVNLYCGGESRLADLLGAKRGETVGFRPESVRWVSVATGLPVRVKSCAYWGNRYAVVVETEEGEKIKGNSPEELRVGERVGIDLEPEALMLLGFGGS